MVYHCTVVKDGDMFIAQFPDKKHFQGLAVFAVYILIIRQIIGRGILKADSLIRGVTHNAEAKQIFPGTEQVTIYGEKHISLGMMLANTSTLRFINLRFALAVQVHFAANQSPVEVNLPVVADGRQVEAREKRRRVFHCKGDDDSPFPLRHSKGRKKSPLGLAGLVRQLQLADNDITPACKFPPGPVTSVERAQVRYRVKTRLEIERVVL
ncbi:hypothetical protein FACS1894172_11950 [Spirochaetia bacterium]|nr:hypothetical protein FACS1894172_11950 [Spirochaetia bacterium]